MSAAFACVVWPPDNVYTVQFGSHAVPAVLYFRNRNLKDHLIVRAPGGTGVTFGNTQKDNCGKGPGHYDEVGFRIYRPCPPATLSLPMGLCEDYEQCTLSPSFSPCCAFAWVAHVEVRSVLQGPRDRDYCRRWSFRPWISPRTTELSPARSQIPVLERTYM